MLTCNACLRRCLRTVTADATNIHLPIRPPPSTGPCTQRVARRRRGYATESTPIENPQASAAVLDVGIRQQYLPESRPRQQRHDVFSKGNLEREVLWLRDPLKLGDHVVQLLRQDGTEKALALVRMASKDIQCTVSWNYLIDFHMSKGKPSDAIKLYNEVRANLFLRTDEPSRLMIIADEEAGTATGRSHFHHHLPGLIMASKASPLCYPRPIYIPLDVCGQLSRQALHNPHQRSTQSLRSRR